MSKTRRENSENANKFGLIGSSIIPNVSIIGVPLAREVFPKQKLDPHDSWHFFGPAVLQASVVGGQLVRQSSISARSGESEEETESSTRTGRTISRGRLNPSDDELSDEEKSSKTPSGSTPPRSVLVNETAKRFLISKNPEPKSIGENSEPTGISSIRLDQGKRTEQKNEEDLNDRKSSSSELTTSDTNKPGKIQVLVTAQPILVSVQKPIPSKNLPTSRSKSTVEENDKTPRSSINDATTAPTSARSVSFRENLEEIRRIKPDKNGSDSNSETSSETVIDRTASRNSVKINPEEKSENFPGKNERKIDDEIEKLRELNDELTAKCRKFQEEMNKQKRPDDQSSSNEKLKKERDELRRENYRLNAALSEYQSEKESCRHDGGTHGLPSKAPIPIWLLDKRFLSPLIVFYEEKLAKKDEFIFKLKEKLKEIENEFSSIVEVRPVSTGTSVEMEKIKQQAIIVLETNKSLLQQIDFQANLLSDVQKSQNHEVEALTRRLTLFELEKNEAERKMAMLKAKNDELRSNFEKINLEKDQRLDVEQHFQEIQQMKRSFEVQTETHSAQIKILQRRIQDAESTKQESLVKLTELRTEIGRIRNENKEIRKINFELENEIKSTQKNLENFHFDSERKNILIEKSREQIEILTNQIEKLSEKLREKNEETKNFSTKLDEEKRKNVELDRRLVSSTNETQEDFQRIQAELKKQIEILKNRCEKHEKKFSEISLALTQKQLIIDDLNAEKRNFSLNLENLWLTSEADNKRMHEQLRSMRLVN